MPDDNDKDQRGQGIPPNPRNIDEAAQAFERNEQRRHETERQVSTD